VVKFNGDKQHLPSLQKATHQNIAVGVDLLKSGKPVSFPTDTVYALGAPITDIACVRKVFEIKRRPLHMALPILLSDPADIESVALQVPDIARELMQEFWPGALTLVLKKTAFVPDIVTAGGPTVAVRIAAHPLAIEIVKRVGVPMVGTSANIHGKPSPLTAQDVFDQIGDKIELILDAGKTPGGVESTILDLSTSKPRILRQGAVPRTAIERFCHLD
jgi:L-threonylcarbamoyladenylate synthase